MVQRERTKPGTSGRPGVEASPPPPNTHTSAEPQFPHIQNGNNNTLLKWTENTAHRNTCWEQLSVSIACSSLRAYMCLCINKNKSVHNPGSRWVWFCLMKTVSFCKQLTLQPMLPVKDQDIWIPRGPLCFPMSCSLKGLVEQGKSNHCQVTNENTLPGHPGMSSVEDHRDHPLHLDSPGDIFHSCYHGMSSLLGPRTCPSKHMFSHPQ